MKSLNSFSFNNEKLTLVASGVNPTDAVNFSQIQNFITGFGTINYIPLWGSNGSLGNSNMYISSGKIGINTTNPLSDLQIGSQASADVATPTILSLGGTRGNSTRGSSNNLKLRLYDAANPSYYQGLGITQNLLEINAGLSGNIGYFVNGGTEVSTMTSSGIGIFNTSPSVALDVVGNFKLVNGTQGLNKVLTSDANGLASWQTNTSTPADATTTTKGIVQLAGDLGGTAALPSVLKINGIGVTGTPTTGQVLTATSGTAASWASSTGITINPTTNYLPIKTGATTFGDSPLSSNGTNMLTNSYILKQANKHIQQEFSASSNIYRDVLSYKITGTQTGFLNIGTPIISGLNAYYSIRIKGFNNSGKPEFTMTLTGKAGDGYVLGSTDGSGVQVRIDGNYHFSNVYVGRIPPAYGGTYNGAVFIGSATTTWTDLNIVIDEVVINGVTTAVTNNHGTGWSCAVSTTILSDYYIASSINKGAGKPAHNEFSASSNIYRDVLSYKITGTQTGFLNIGTPIVNGANAYYSIRIKGFNNLGKPEFDMTVSGKAGDGYILGNTDGSTVQTRIDGNYHFSNVYVGRVPPFYTGGIFIGSATTTWTDLNIVVTEVIINGVTTANTNNYATGWSCAISPTINSDYYVASSINKGAGKIAHNEFSSTSNIYRDVLSYKITGTQTGYLNIITPIANGSDIYYSIRIKGFNNSGKPEFITTISGKAGHGYVLGNTDGSTMQVRVEGNPPFSNIYTGRIPPVYGGNYNGGIFLGVASTTWTDLNILIDEVIINGVTTTNTNNYATGWSCAIATTIPSDYYGAAPNIYGSIISNNNTNVLLGNYTSFGLKTPIGSVTPIYNFDTPSSGLNISDEGKMWRYNSVTNKIELSNTVTAGSFKLATGAGIGKFLQSDANGNASWATAQNIGNTDLSLTAPRFLNSAGHDYTHYGTGNWYLGAGVPFSAKHVIYNTEIGKTSHRVDGLAARWVVGSSNGGVSEYYGSNLNLYTFAGTMYAGFTSSGLTLSNSAKVTGLPTTGLMGSDAISVTQADNTYEKKTLQGSINLTNPLLTDGDNYYQDTTVTGVVIGDIVQCEQKGHFSGSSGVANSTNGKVTIVGIVKSTNTVQIQVRCDGIYLSNIGNINFKVLKF